MIRKPAIYCFQHTSEGRIRLRAEPGRRWWAACKPLSLRARWGALAFLVFVALGRSQTAEVPVPTVDADLGPCSVDFTVTDQKFQPLYNAQIRVRFKYGFWGMKRMDLQIGTNSAGKARVKGLPSKLRRPPLDFVVTYGKASQDWYWTGLDCVDQTQVVLHVP
jgi:hypothetical protein